MTVKQLKEQLESYPDETVVAVEKVSLYFGGKGCEELVDEKVWYREANKLTLDGALIITHES